MNIFRNRPRPGTVASDELVDVSTQDLERAEQGIARGALRELDAMDAHRNSAEKRRSAEQRASQERQSSERSRGPSVGGADIPTIRGGVARILNAAAEAVEEYLDVEEDEDRVPMIPETDRFESMRDKVDNFIAQAEPIGSEPTHRASMESNESLSQRNASLRSRGASLESRARSIPGVERSSTEQFNEKVRALGAQASSPFQQSQLQKDPISPAPDRRLLRSENVAFDRRSNTSFEIMGRDKVRDSVLAQSQARQSLGLAPLVRMQSTRPNFSHPPRPPRLSDSLPPQVRTEYPSQDPNHRYSMDTTPSRGLGTIEEVRYGDAGQLVRRRIALPWQMTLTFGVITSLGCLAGLTTLGIAIRNVIYLNGPKAGPQIPDVLRTLDQILEILGDPQLHIPQG